MKYTGVILAGGMSRRMGKDKGALLLGKQTVIEHVIETVSQVVDDLILITNKPENYRRLGIPMFPDILQAKGSLVGIHAGLVASQTQYSLFVACDMPFIKKQFLEYMISKLQHGQEGKKEARSNPSASSGSISKLQEAIEIVVPKFRLGYEPLCAIYSKKCIPEIESMANNNIMKILLLFEKFRTCVISEDEISSLDSEDSFFNINSKEDYKKALELMEERKHGSYKRHNSG